MFFWTFYASKNLEKHVSQFLATFSMTLFNIEKNKCWPTNQHIRMISEGCDTDWSNKCWKFSFATAGINYIFLYIQIEIVILNCKNLMRNIHNQISDFLLETLKETESALHLIKQIKQIPKMLGRFFYLNKTKMKIISNHMSQYFIHSRTKIKNV